MKTLLLSLLLTLLVSLASNAQTQKGTIMAGGYGSAGFKESFHIALHPNLGFLVTDDLAVGSGVDLSYFRKKEYNSISGGLQPFVRYYFGQPSATRVFAQANGMINWIRSKDAYLGEPKIYTTSQKSFGGGVGIVHFVTKQVGLEAQLSYGQDQGSSSPILDRISLRLGIQIHLIKSAKQQTGANNPADL